ncbi:MAG: hypothetical protein ACXVPU_10770 [Bacteroidia bacterium]
MNTQNEIREKDVLGMDKPVNQLKHPKKNNGTWFFVFTLIILMVSAAVVVFLKK